MARTVEKAISAISDRFVKMEYAEKHPNVTVVVKYRVGRIKHHK